MPPSNISNSTINNQIIQFVLEGKKENGQKIITFDIKNRQGSFYIHVWKIIVQIKKKYSSNLPDNLFELD